MINKLAVLRVSSLRTFIQAQPSCRSINAKEPAERIEHSTVESHIRLIYQKLDIPNRIELVRKYLGAAGQIQI
jgi:hypothetical protein